VIKRQLGNTGIQVSEVAFGCVEIGMPYGMGVESANDMPAEDEAIHLLQTALQSGVNFFDTAPAYGTSETILGKAFNQTRSEVVIATKCKYFQNSDGTLPAYDKLKQIIHTSLQESLTALQTDYIDIYMLHQSTEEILNSADVRAIFAELKQSGVIRATGASVYTNQQTELVINAGGWDVIQVPFNIMDQRQAEMFDKLHNSGIGVIIRSVLLRGMLTDKGVNLHPELAGVESHIQKIKAFSNQQQVSLSTLAPRFVLSYPQVSSILVGIDKLSYLEESIAAANGEYLEDEIFEQAKTLAYPDPAFIDLPKWDRAGWVQ